MSTQSFADLGVSDVVVSTLAGGGITEPFAVQRLVIGDVLAGRDVLAKSPTGSGKTLAFGIPMVDRIASDGPRPAALVLSPTRELAQQIVEDIRPIAHARALRVTAVYGGAGLVKQAREAGRSHILVATPGRLEDLLARGAFSLSQIKLLVLDEADRMLDMGFRPAVDRIVNACRDQRQTLFFSATLDGAVGEVAHRYTRDAILHEHEPVQRRDTAQIEHRFIRVTHEGRLGSLVTELSRERQLTLVFVRTKRGADRLVKRLQSHGITALAMHGNKTQGQRERALASFESGRVDTLVATDVAARGIDIANISHVINFDPPPDRDAYVHRIGRTGRAGRPGIGITLVDSAQRHEVSRFARQLGIDHGLGGDDGVRAAPAARQGAGNGRQSAGSPRQGGGAAGYGAGRQGSGSRQGAGSRRRDGRHGRGR
jgi:ATP-dependent RNA helicase RhlE